MGALPHYEAAWILEQELILAASQTPTQASYDALILGTPSRASQAADMNVANAIDQLMRAVAAATRIPRTPLITADMIQAVIDDTQNPMRTGATLTDSQ